MKRSNVTKPAARKRERALCEFALAYPESREDFPWGHRAIKVRDKIFTTINADAEGLRLSFKLPQSNLEALDHPFTEPTHYGMGKHGWVTADFAPDVEPPMDLLRDWIDESYRAIAPKKLVAQLEGEPASPIEKPAKKTAKKQSKRKPAKKAPAKKAAKRTTRK